MNPTRGADSLKAPHELASGVAARQAVGPHRLTRRTALIVVSALGIVAAPVAGAFGPLCGGSAVACVTLVPGIVGLVGLLVNGRMLELASGTALVAWVVTGVAEGQHSSLPVSTVLALGFAAVASLSLLMLARQTGFPETPAPSWYQRGGWIAIALVLAAILWAIAGMIVLTVTASACFSLGSGGF